MLKIVILFALLFTTHFIHAQTDSDVDSLTAHGQNIQYQDPIAAGRVFLKALTEAEKINYLYGKGMSQKGLGVVADVTDQPEKSLYHYAQSFECFMENGDTLDAYKVKFNEGMIYRKLQMYQQAENTFQETAEIFKQFEFPIGIILCNTNYGISLYDRGQFEAALNMFIEVKNASESIQFISPPTYGNIGNSYLSLGELDSSEKYSEMAYDLAIQKEDLKNQSTFGVTLANIYIKREKWSDAIDLFEKCAVIASDNGMINSVIQAKRALHVCYANTADYQNAYERLSDLKMLEDSISTTDFLLSLNEKEAVIENEKSKSEIQILLEREKLAEAESERDQATVRALIIGGISLLIIVILIFLQNLKKRKTNRLLATKNAMIEEQHKEIKDSINYAQQIQAAILTSENEWNKISKEHFIFFQPKDIVSGDFFWAHQNEERNLAIWVAADCTGHGVPGAFMSMLGIGLLNEIIIENKIFDTAKILNQLREKIIKALASKTNQKQIKDGMDLSICIWDKSNNTLQFSGANNPIYIVRKSKEIDEGLKPFFKSEIEDSNLFEIKGDKMPVGAFTEELKSFTSRKIQLLKSDLIYSFSDGLADQFGGINGKKYKYKQFREILLRHSQQPLKMQKDELLRSFEVWKLDFEQVDDICVIGVKIS